ncbi:MULTISPECIES: DNA-binding protein [unclassified Dietzia]|uniref:DNA-binding protein n=1 Tax=unclassified Dietzia TaxID=2617939 RepID=UPI001315D166|nr:MULTISPECIES: DNA-binding protein [unclassified Dietzia]QGW24258.1 hypothetical protein GJR88_01886 [Dietzia sp. DQ12-45-1b]
MATADRSPRNMKWTPEAIRDLGARTDIKTACSVLGISYSLGYQLVREEQFPVKTLRLGNRIIVPVRGLLDVLDIDEAPSLDSAA